MINAPWTARFAALALALTAIACGAESTPVPNPAIPDPPPEVVVEVEVVPSTATIPAGSTRSFASSVTGTEDTAVDWTVSEGSVGGSVTAAGTYTAPATPGTYHVVATSRAHPNKKASAVVVVTSAPPPVEVAVEVFPTSASVAAGASRTFSASVTGTSSTAVTWSVSEGSAGGTVTSAGRYTAPATPGTYHVVATSVADPTKRAVATVSVTPPPPVAVAISPTSASVVAGATRAFSATVTNTSNTAVTWSVTEGSSGGTVTSAGTYTAPATPGTYHVVATSVADPTKSAVATVSVTSAPPPVQVAVAVSPTSASVVAGATRSFSATVTGTSNTAVTWAVTEGSAGGTVTSAGTYTAPATPGTYHVVATSVADPTKSAVASVSVTSAPPPTGGATVAGEPTAPNPTIHNMSLLWPFTGDSDGDGSVSVRYRRVGDGVWRTGMPLRRVPGRSNQGFTWGSRHAGSLFDLEQGTTYEIELSLSDPDGGSTVRTLTATTRTYPAPMAAAPVRSATPSTLASVLSSTQPGDIVELAPGTYPAFTVSRNGAAGRPVVIRAGPSGGVTVNGRITLTGRSHVHVRGLTVNGDIRANGTTSVAVIGNVVNTTANGITFSTRSQDGYVAENVVTGATVWAASSLGVDGNNIGEGIEITGPGHVVEHNRVRGFRDCISLLEDSEAVDQYSIDVVANDLSACADDAIEGDFCFHNCRFMRNRATNTFMAWSSQPSLGGPTYFIRNVAYNVILNAFKLNRGSDGDVLLHNTVVKNGDAFNVNAGTTHYRQYARNNLFIGGPGGSYGGYSSGSGRVIQLADADVATQDLDHDCYGSTTGSFTGRIGSITFANLTELRSRTTEAHATSVGLNVFASPVGYPSNPVSEYASPDLRIGGSSAAVDKGAIIPNVTDGFLGAAPDCGALEAGAPLPLYGPRPGGVP